jgi:hypothetical protein
VINEYLNCMLFSGKVVKYMDIFRCFRVQVGNVENLLKMLKTIEEVFYIVENYVENFFIIVENLIIIIDICRK